MSFRNKVSPAPPGESRSQSELNDPNVKIRKVSSSNSLASTGGGSRKFRRGVDFADSDIAGDGTKPIKSQVTIQAQNTIRQLLPQVMNEQNRKTHGTWQRQFDFTRTIIGYVLGIHNFFRFPYLCYKYGGVFFIPYILMMLCVGVPVVFMEFTIGQYYGVGSYVAFSHMAPILSCVSKLLTWSCVVNCWLYTAILAWLRIFASDSTSCLRGWEVCDQGHFYNSPHCWTALADDDCNDPALAKYNNLSEQDVLSQDLMYYNFKCRSVQYFCEQQGWTVKPGYRKCSDEEGNERSIYERRYHATQEYLYGAVLGLQRNMELEREVALVNETLNVTGFSTMQELYVSLFNSSEYEEEERQYYSHVFDIELSRMYLKYLRQSRNETLLKSYDEILDRVTSPYYQKKYWTQKGQKLSECVDSSSFIAFKYVSVTTWIMIAVFLFEDLLKVSSLSILLNAVPFAILLYVTGIALNFRYSYPGIQQIFTVKESFLSDLGHWDMWAEAVVQVIYTSGIGTGVLISLATYNNFDKNFRFDIYCTLSMSLTTSFCGVIITFCTISHYLTLYDIDVPFRKYIDSDASPSSVEFCFIAYSHFLTLIRDSNVYSLLFFFMVTSFATDTAIRLVQNVYDAVVAISPRLRHHNITVLIAVCVLGYLILAPVMKNGGIILFVDFEYFVMQYMLPTIVAVEIGAVIFIYKASRLVDHAEQMGVFYTYAFRVFITGLMYAAFISVATTVIINIANHEIVRFNGVEAESVSETFGWTFVVTPFIVAILSIIKQLIVIPMRRWKWLFAPLTGKDRKVRRAFLRRAHGGKQKKEGEGEATDQEQIRAAAARMRVLESRFLLAMMQHRREEQQKKAKEQKHKKKYTSSKHDDEDSISVTSVATSVPFNPLFASLVRVAALEFGAGGPKQMKDHHHRGSSSSSSDDENKPGCCEKLKKKCTWTEIKKCFKSNKPQKKTENEEEIEERKEGKRLEYVELMDHFERWPGRLDESEIESEGSSLGYTSEEEDEKKDV